ncbi:MAG: cold-shock protein [Alphaproteobacteria bacterium]
MSNYPTSTTAHTSPEVFEVHGTIKWFSAQKGYGFITPQEQGLEDILLHITCLRAGGFQTAAEGATVHIEALRQANKGIKAFRIITMDDSTATTPSTFSSDSYKPVVPETDFETATVDWFNRPRGFGFLSRDRDFARVFVHVEDLRRAGFTELRHGQKVQIRTGMGAKGLAVAAIRPNIPETQRDTSR